MSAKRGEEEAKAALAGEGLKGAREAVANELAAAEPEMPPLLAEPAAEARRIEVYTFERNARHAMATLPIMPTIPTERGRQRQLACPPIFGGAARLFLGAEFSDAPEELSPLDDDDAAYDGETITPTLYACADEPTEIHEEAAAEPAPRRASPPMLQAVPLAAQADIPTRPCLAPVAPPHAPHLAPHAAPHPAGAASRGKTQRAEGVEVSRWVVWGIAVALSVVVASWVFFMHNESTSARVAQLENARPPETPAAPEGPAAARDAQPKPARTAARNANPDIVQLALAPSPDSAPKLPPSEETPQGLEVANTAKPGVLDVSAPVASSPQEERFLRGLEAARRHSQKEEFKQVLGELKKIEELHKKYPAHASEFIFLYWTAWVFEQADAKQMGRALQMLTPLRVAYRNNANYWRARGLANQLLADQAEPPEQCTFWSQAKSAYTELLRLVRNNPEDRRSVSFFIEGIEDNLRDYCG